MLRWIKAFGSYMNEVGPGFIPIKPNPPQHTFWHFLSLQPHPPKKERPPVRLPEPPYIPPPEPEPEPSHEQQLAQLERELQAELALIDRLPLDDEEKEVAKKHRIREFFSERE